MTKAGILICSGVIISILIAVLIVLLIKIREIDEKEEKYNNEKYKIKEQYLTPTEVKFGNALKKIVTPMYLIYPQVPLSQIVEKISGSKYRNELYRVVDFCIFNAKYKPLVVIEINDNTHNTKERYIRDMKVKEILDKANLPIITLWTSYGVNYDYIERRLKEYIEL
jgi:hypothetical protein